ncbi:MAG: nuclear transport factor 2 family protein [Solirubrobacterales bacterium]
MSQDTVELLTSATEAFIAGERDAYVDNYFAEDVEIRPDAAFPEAEPFRGREAYKRFLAEIDRGWERGGIVVLKEIVSVEDRVVVRLDWGGKGRASGIDMNSNLTAICTVRDGWVIRVEYFFDHSEALEAVGLAGG